MGTYFVTAAGFLILWALSWWFAKRFARQAPYPSRPILPPPASGAWLVLLGAWAAYSALHAAHAPRLPLLIGAGYLLVVALVDYWTGYIPDSAHVAALLLAAAWQVSSGSFSLWAPAAGAGMIAALSALWLLRKGGVGGGDMKLGGVLGFSLGILTAASIFWVASLSALAWAVLAGRTGRGDRIRMGPHFLTAYVLILSVPPAWLPSALQPLVIG